jgi:hypothetical protein
MDRSLVQESLPSAQIISLVNETQCFNIVPMSLMILRINIDYTINQSAFVVEMEYVFLLLL